MRESNDVVTGLIYTRNTARALVPAGVDGPLGDSLIVSGLAYRKPDLSGEPIGTFDLTAVTTSISDVAERRELSIELTFNRKFAKRSWIAELKPAFKRPKQAAEVSLTGIETFPLNGAILDRGISFGVATGTGPFIGADGTASITYNPTNQFYTYRFDLI